MFVICLLCSVEYIVISLVFVFLGIIWVFIDVVFFKECLNYFLENCYVDLVVMDKFCEFGNVIVFDVLIEFVLFVDGVFDVILFD